MGLQHRRLRICMLVMFTRQPLPAVISPYHDPFSFIVSFQILFLKTSVRNRFYVTSTFCIYNFWVQFTTMASEQEAEQIIRSLNSDIK